MITGSLALIALMCAMVTAVVLMGKRNILESCAVGASFMLCLYVLVSYFLLFIDSFSVISAVSGTFVISALTLSGVMIFRKGKKFACDTDLRKALIPILVSLMLVPFVSVKNEYYGMGQDQGGYQTQALLYLKGDTSKIHDFDEYYKLSEDDHDDFISRVDCTNGLDAVQDGYGDPSYSAAGSESMRYIHGIPSFSALMAGWASIFGISNMQGIQTMIYVLVIFLVYFTAKNLGLRRMTAALACFATGFAPAVIWLFKSAFTEPYMALLIILFMYLLTLDDHKVSCILSIVPVIVFGCYHVSVYTVLPLFLGVYAFRYIMSAHKYYIGLMGAIPVIQIVSFFTMKTIQPIYTQNNYKRLFILGWDGHEISDLPGQVILTAVIYAVLIGVFVIAINPLVKKSNRITILRQSKVFAWLLRAMIVLPILKVFYERSLAHWSGARAAAAGIMSSTLYHYALSGGIILFAIAIIAIVIRPGEMISDINTATLSVLFFYLVLVYSSVLNKGVTPLMYYSRYIVPFISITVLFVLLIAERTLKGKKAYAILPLFAVSMSIFIPTNIAMLEGRDDTRVTWDVLEDVSKIPGESDALIVADNSRMLLWMPMHAMTADGVDVYPQMHEFEDQARDLLDDHDSVYVVKRYPIYDTDTPFELVYTNTYPYQEDLNFDTFMLTLYPTAFGASDETIYVYRWTEGDTREYPISDFYDYYTGLAGYEGTYAWTGSEEVTLSCELLDRDYTMNVDLMNGIPYDAAGIDHIDINVSINGTYVDTVTVSQAQNGDGFSIVIDDELINEGDNTITFTSDLWSSSAVNPADGRMLGYAIENVTFEG